MKTVIIEDERLVAEELQSAINDVASDIEVVQVLPSLKQAKAWLEQHTMPDLFFMDIKLADGLSFELFDMISITAPVIFCTAYEEYAIRAFKVSGVDYLLKPVQEADLKQAIDKVRKLKQQENVAMPDIKALLDQFGQAGQAKAQYRERFIIHHLNKWIPVEANDIALIQRTTLNYFYRFSGEKLIYDYTSLDEIEEVLDPHIFFRANRQSIVNIKAIDVIKPLDNQKLIIHLVKPFKDTIDVSREKAPLLKRWLDK